MPVPSLPLPQTPFLGHQCRPVLNETTSSPQPRTLAHLHTYTKSLLCASCPLMPNDTPSGPAASRPGCPRCQPAYPALPAQPLFATFSVAVITWTPAMRPPIHPFRKTPSPFPAASEFPLAPHNPPTTPSSPLIGRWSLRNGCRGGPPPHQGPGYVVAGCRDLSRESSTRAGNTARQTTRTYVPKVLGALESPKSDARQPRCPAMGGSTLV